MSRHERRLTQQLEEVAHLAQQQERPNREPQITPEGERCPVRLGPYPHQWWTSRQDGKQRCYFCCKVRG